METTKHRYGCRCWQCNEAKAKAANKKIEAAAKKLNAANMAIRKPEDFGMPGSTAPAQKRRRPAPQK